MHKKEKIILNALKSNQLQSFQFSSPPQETTQISLSTLGDFSRKALPVGQDGEGERKAVPDYYRSLKKNNDSIILQTYILQLSETS